MIAGYYSFYGSRNFMIKEETNVPGFRDGKFAQMVEENDKVSVFGQKQSRVAGRDNF